MTIFLGVDLTPLTSPDGKVVPANFSGAKLRGARFLSWKEAGKPDIQTDGSLAIFQGADLSAYLTVNSRQDMKRAKLDDVIFRGANFEGANLERAELEGVDFSPFKNPDGSLKPTDLRRANFRGAWLSKTLDQQLTDFSMADLSGANFSSITDPLQYTQLRFIIFSGANLQGVNFSEGIFRRANFSPFKNPKGSLKPTDLRQANFKGTQFIAGSTDFSMADLSGADFSASMINNQLQYVELKKTIFSGANLQGSNFLGGQFEGVDFSPFENPDGTSVVTSFQGADLQDARFDPFLEEDIKGIRADFQDANFRGAIFRAGDFRGANFSGANLAGVDLSRPNLASLYTNGQVSTRTGFFEANLQGATLKGDLKDTDFASADLSLATLSDANLERSFLQGAILSGAALDGANLVEARLVSAKLSSFINLNGDVTPTDLTRADLSRADLFEAKVQSAIFTGAIFKATTWVDDKLCDPDPPLGVCRVGPPLIPPLAG